MVVFQQADLDTCMAAAVLGVEPAANVAYRLEGARPEELADAGCLCLEAGGSGQREQNNFDHHTPGLALPPACVQAWEHAGRPPDWARLVEFAALVDLGQRERIPPFPNLSNLISGVRLVWKADPLRQFREGLAVLLRVRDLALDPFEPLPSPEEWRGYLETRQRQFAAVPKRVEWWACGGLRAAVAEAKGIGAAGWLYRQGAEIAVVGRRLPGPDARWKVVVGSPVRRVDAYLPALLAEEDGWGGPSHGTILASPRRGTRFSPHDVRRILEKATISP
jgi:hypothetical protein